MIDRESESAKVTDPVTHPAMPVTCAVLKVEQYLLLSDEMSFHELLWALDLN